MAIEWTAEQFAEVASADDRVRTMVQALELEAMLVPGQPLAVVMEAIAADASEAMKAFANADLGNTRHVQDLQARVYRNQVAYATFEWIMARGAQARESIRGDEPIAGDV